MRSLKEPVIRRSPDTHPLAREGCPDSVRTDFASSQTPWRASLDTCMADITAMSRFELPGVGTADSTLLRFQCGALQSDVADGEAPVFGAHHAFQR